MMCKWGTDTVLDLPIPAHLSHTGKRYMKKVPVDTCIAPIVKALDAAGFEMTDSCCGHEKAHGMIGLADGRCLMIIKAKFYEEEGEG